MAYILGFIFTDGCLIESINGLNITNKNREILERIAKTTSSNHKIGVKFRGELPRTNFFQIQIRDKIIYADLLKLGLTPRKSKTVRLPDIPKEYLSDFIRGCFDGDGTINVRRDPRWKYPWQTRTAFSSDCCAFLRDLQHRLYKETGLNRGSIQNAKRAYLLCYSITDSIKLYNFMYHNTLENLLFLKDKRNKFEFFKKVRPDVFQETASHW